MQNASKTRRRLFLPAIPSNEAEQGEWDALSDEERLALFNEMLNDTSDNRPVEDTMEDILVEARACGSTQRAQRSVAKQANPLEHRATVIASAAKQSTLGPDAALADQHRNSKQIPERGWIASLRSQ